jgi:transcriptional regulator with XRE-family HTH domain
MVRKNDFVSKVDAHVGRKIVEIRLAFGLTRNDVASKVGVTHQQFSKYEKGENRMSIGRLIQVAAVFGKPPSYFYEGITKYVLTPEEESRQRLALEYSKNFKGIKNQSIKETINKLVALLGKCS